MGKRSPGSRVVIYSHDSFGLGHLRRCRTIAHALVGEHKSMSVLILSGSPIIGSFDFRSRVDFVRIPGVIKLRNGQYTPLSLHMDIEETVALRASIIEHTTMAFNPDLFLVDKEPLGLRGEIEGTLRALKARGTPIALGLRDVMDEPALLVPEWDRKRVVPALRSYFDEIWVYGLPQICDPLSGIALPASVKRKMVYTGYLRRTEWQNAVPSPTADWTAEPYILVTPGGGGDGVELIDWVLRAYESDAAMPNRALLVFGPFMPPERQAEFHERVNALHKVEAITFDTHIETLIRGAAGIVAMGGYNIFCEILSFDKPALVVPRTRPRMEQYLRISRAQELGLVSMLEYSNPPDPQAMATAIRHLPQQARPSEVVIPGLLDGLPNVNRLVTRWLEEPRHTRRPRAAGQR